MSYAAVLSNFSVFEDICEIPFSLFIKAKAEIFCGSKTMFDGAAEKTTLSQADLEVGCTSFPPPLQCECIIVWAVAVRNDNRG